MQPHVVNHTILLLILSAQSDKVIYLFQKTSKHSLPLFAVLIIFAHIPHQYNVLGGPVSEKSKEKTFQGSQKVGQYLLGVMEPLATGESMSSPVLWSENQQSNFKGA